MGLTRDFRETVAARARRDAGFRKALRAEGIAARRTGDTRVAQAVVRDLRRSAPRPTRSKVR